MTIEPPDLGAAAKAWADAARGDTVGAQIVAERAFHAALAANDAEIERLTKALEPFAKAWTYSCHPNAGEGLPWNTTPAHYEAAAAALRAQPATEVEHE